GGVAVEDRVVDAEALLTEEGLAAELDEDAAVAEGRVFSHGGVRRRAEGRAKGTAGAGRGATRPTPRPSAASAAEGEADEADDARAGALQHLLDGHRGVLHEGLLDEHVVLEVAVELALRDAVE